MYEKLIKSLRVEPFEVESIGLARTMNEAADAIEELQADNAALNGTVSNLVQQIAELSKPKWFKIESRSMDDEERKYYSEHYGYDLDDHEAVIYCCQLPEHGQ